MDNQFNRDYRPIFDKKINRLKCLTINRLRNRPTLFAVLIRRKEKTTCT